MEIQHNFYANYTCLPSRTLVCHLTWHTADNYYFSVKYDKQQQDIIDILSLTQGTYKIKGKIIELNKYDDMEIPLVEFTEFKKQ